MLWLNGCDHRQCQHISCQVQLGVLVKSLNWRILVHSPHYDKKVENLDQTEEEEEEDQGRVSWKSPSPKLGLLRIDFAGILLGFESHSVCEVLEGEPQGPRAAAAAHQFSAPSLYLLAKVTKTRNQQPRYMKNVYRFGGREDRWLLILNWFSDSAKSYISGKCCD